MNNSYSKSVLFTAATLAASRGFAAAAVWQQMGNGYAIVTVWASDTRGLRVWFRRRKVRRIKEVSS